jgi:hypothetical protein
VADKAPKQIHEDWQVDVNDYQFFDKIWQDWAPVFEVIPVDMEKWNDWYGDEDRDYDEEPKGETISIDPLEDANDLVRNVITGFRSWGQGPVLAAMKGLGINSVNDQTTADQVMDWLGENFGSIFEGDYDFSDVPSIPEYTYEPTRMNLKYEPRYTDAELTIRRAYGGVHHSIDRAPEFNFNNLVEGTKTNSLYD